MQRCDQESQHTQVSNNPIDDILQERNEYHSGSDDYPISLSENEQECLGLTDAEMKKKIKEKKQKSYHWTGVVSTAHFTIAGCHDILLTEDMTDAWADIEAAHQDGVLPWEFVFDAKEYELPNSVKSLQPYRLTDDELKELGEKVTRLRELFAAKAATIKAYGDVFDT